MGSRRGYGDRLAPTASPAFSHWSTLPLMSKGFYFCLLPLFLLFRFLFRQGSSGGMTGRVARKALPSKRDARERRDRGICLESDVLWVIIALAFLLENVTFRQSLYAYAEPE